MKIKIVFLPAFLQFLFLSCTALSAESRKISVMNWNLETFFDAVDDGTEYKEFTGTKSKWNREKYEIRLDRLAQVVRTLDCDVVVVEELEKAGQVRDIKNRLPRPFWKKPYKYSFFAHQKGSPIGCAVLSRYPIVKATIHSLDIQSENTKQPPLRPIIRAILDVDGKEITLFANHWKSKSGGAEQSEIWRNYQEKLLSKLILESVSRGEFVVACGDFNRAIEEFKFEQNESANIELKGGAAVFSPWYSENGKLTEDGSYVFKGKWEKIDHFFLAGGARAVRFSAEKGEWCDKNGNPKKYSVKSGRGYSDHLPLKCTVAF